MSSNSFKNFIRNLGFSEENFKEESRIVFEYDIPIGNAQSEKVRYVHTPTNEDIFEEHQQAWNKNSINSFVAVGNNETNIIDAKAKPKNDKPLAAKIKTFIPKDLKKKN